MAKQIPFAKSELIAFKKFDDDARQAFGWASVITKGDDTVFDDQDDGFTADEFEPAVYVYVKESRNGTESHAQVASSLIESNMLTFEKQAEMGIECINEAGERFEGWWVGYEFHDEDTWGKVRSGDLPCFSIAGYALDEEAA